jgi:hypothetical protein
MTVTGHVCVRGDWRPQADEYLWTQPAAEPAVPGGAIGLGAQSLGSRTAGTDARTAVALGGEQRGRAATAHPLSLTAPRHACRFNVRGDDEEDL